MSRGIDSAKTLTDYGRELIADGYTFVIGYYFIASAFKDRLSLAQTSHFSSLGIWNLGIWEGGYPTSADYFTAAQGNFDGIHAAQQAKDAGQPEVTPIYFAADYDSNPADITPYARAFQEQVKACGYTAGVYGNGVTCKVLYEAGIISHTWLSQSTGFQGYNDWKASANIVQGPEFNWRGFDVDGDTANGDSGAWKVASQ